MCIRSCRFLYGRIPPSGWSRKNPHKGFCEGCFCVPTAVSSVCMHSFTLLGFRLVSEENSVWVQLLRFCNRLLKKKERSWEEVGFPGDFRGMVSLCYVYPRGSPDKTWKGRVPHMSALILSWKASHSPSSSLHHLQLLPQGHCSIQIPLSLVLAPRAAVFPCLYPEKLALHQLGASFSLGWVCLLLVLLCSCFGWEPDSFYHTLRFCFCELSFVMSQPLYLVCQRRKTHPR